VASSPILALSAAPIAYSASPFYRKSIPPRACQRLIRLTASGGHESPALFTISPDADGEPVLTWLAIGYHDVYQ
jgi:hypothetical protein